MIGQPDRATTTEGRSQGVSRRNLLAGGSAALLGLTAAACTASNESAPSAGASATGVTATSTTAMSSPAPTTASATASSAPVAAPTTGQSPKAAIADLRKRLRGSVLLPGDANYDTASTARNGRYLNVRPAVIAQCADTQDVVTALSWAEQQGLPPVVRGGGHSYAGYSNTNGLEIDISRLNTVEIDNSKGTAVLGGAALNKDVFTAAKGGKWILPAGTCGLVAIGGLTLGGGIGYHTHWAGLTCDHLTETTVVTADGQVRTANSRENADLFWACRGGAGGNFGVNVSFSYDLAEIPRPNSVFYRLTWRGADAATAMLAAVDKVLHAAPAQLNLSSSVTATPVGAGGPREAIDVMCRGHFLGSVADLTDLLAPLLAIRGITKQITDQPFWTTAETFVSNEADAHSWGDISRYVKDPVPQAAYAKMVDLVAECPSRSTDANGSLWSLGWVGGSVVDKFKPTDTAYAHRNMTTLLRPTPVWPNNSPAAVGNELMAWTLDVTSVIDPYSPGNSYQNFPNRFLDGWETAYYAQNWDRLRDVKTVYDPRNVFRNIQSIPPKFG